MKSPSLKEQCLLWILWHHQGASSKFGQPIRKVFGMGECQAMTDARRQRAKEIREGK